MNEKFLLRRIIQTKVVIALDVFMNMVGKFSKSSCQTFVKQTLTQAEWEAIKRIKGGRFLIIEEGGVGCPS